MDLVIHRDIQFEGTLEESNVGLISTSLRSDGSKVISFNCNSNNEIEKMTIWIKLEEMVHTSFYLDFPLQSHKPNQLLKHLSLGWRGDEDKRHNTRSDVYVREIETGRSRNKFKKPCYDWRDYDSTLWKKILKDIGCKPFYHESKKLKKL